MATISHSDLAPAEEVHYSLAGSPAVEFDLTASGSYELDDSNVEGIANARAHPWLKVEVAQPEPGTPADPAVEVRFPSTAVDAGLDQKVPEYEGQDDEVAETLAADDEQGDEPIVVDEPDTPDEPGDEPVQE